MKTNVGIYDQVVRTLLAFAVACFYYFKVIDGTIADVLLIVAGIFVLSSLFGFCPLYNLFHIDTDEKHSRTKSLTGLPAYRCRTVSLAPRRGSLNIFYK